MPAPRSRAKVALADRHDPQGLAAFVMRYLEWLRVHNYAGPTVESREVYLGYFVAWCTERGIATPREVTKPILERYQRSLYQWRKRDGSPLSFRGQHARLVPVRALFKWLTRQNHLLYNPASELELPRLEHRLPKHVLTIFEVEQVMRTVDLTEPRGLRDRAILEVLYSTGIRRRELIGLALFDFDRERGTVMIRQGKGKKDRMIPVGDRAMGWVDRYQHQVRPDLVVGREIAHLATLFLTHTGAPFTPNRLTQLVRRYVQAADLGKSGSCHLFRHTMATHAGERRRHPLHPGNARACGAVHHADLHPGLHPQAQTDPHRHAPRETAHGGRECPWEQYGAERGRTHCRGRAHRLSRRGVRGRRRTRR